MQTDMKKRKFTKEQKLQIIKVPEGWGEACT